MQVKVLLVALVAVMIGLLVYVNNESITGSDQTSFSKPDYVERLIPESGSETLQQGTVGVDLAKGYNAYLVINGVTIKNDVTETDDDGLRRAPTLGTVEYDPAPNHRIKALDTPTQCVDAWVWKIIDGPSTAKQVNWCFKVT
jgi:hypothetical protein